MAALIFRCPRTGKEIDTGIDADQETRRSLNILICRVPCPYCRFDHFPQVKRGEFVSPACEEIPSEMATLLSKLASQRRPRPTRLEPTRAAHESCRAGPVGTPDMPPRRLIAD
jgi:hypothetical protein